MTSAIKAWVRRMMPGLHPEFDELVHWAHRPDGAEPPALSAHMRSCPQCNREVQRIRLARDAAETDTAEHLPALSEVFESLECGMRAWSALQAPDADRISVRPSDTEPRLTTQALELYFGKEAAQRIQVSARWNDADDRLLPASKLLFHTFLGRRAAAALARQIAGQTG